MTNRDAAPARRPFSVIPPCVYGEASRRAGANGAASEDVRTCASDAASEAVRAAAASGAAGGADVADEGDAACGDALDGAALDERLAYVQQVLLRERAARASSRRPQERSPFYGVLQDFVDSLFDGADDAQLRRLDVVVAAESAELPADLLEVVELLPPGSYTRQRLCGQLNSAIGAHAWSRTYGTVS